MVEGSSEYSTIARNYTTAKETAKLKRRADLPKRTVESDERNRASAINFKSLHLLVVVFFLWIL